MKVLSRVNASVLRGSPRGSVDRGSTVSRAREGLPVNEECDGVFGLGDAVVRFSRSDARGSAGHNSSGDRLPLEEPAAYVDVVG
jgi:hypothetical protein